MDLSCQQWASRVFGEFHCRISARINVQKTAMLFRGDQTALGKSEQGGALRVYRRGHIQVRGRSCFETLEDFIMQAAEKGEIKKGC